MTGKKIIRWVGGAAALIAVALLGVFLWLRTSLPQEQGEMTAAGLNGTVTIIRDQHGIPTIHAASERDAYFALGFVHAQDRLWQMDMMRRAGAGRLAEIIGPAALPSDRLMRTLGLYRLAEAEFGSLAPEVRAAFEAYADGVNAYLSGHKGAWPIEYYVLRTRPQPWKPADLLVWGRLMALRLATDFREEMLRARLLQRLTPAQILDLWPAYRPGWPESDWPRCRRLVCARSPCSVGTRLPPPFPMSFRRRAPQTAGSWTAATAKAESRSSPTIRICA